jgi:hypothetical protein
MLSLKEQLDAQQILLSVKREKICKKHMTGVWKKERNK